MDSKRALRQFRELKKLGKVMRLAAEEWDEEWKTLISIIMSAQTRDETTIPVAGKLFEEYGNVERLARARVARVEKIIGRVNFHKTKARNIIACCKNLVAEYDGKVPHDVNELLKLPGVGRKTANVFLAEYGELTIGVDTHVNYISNYLGWANSKDAHKVELALEKLFSKRYWGELNWVLVTFGKTHTSRKKKNEILDRVKKVR